MKKIFYIVLIISGMCLTTGAFAQIDNVGTSAASFLKIGIGPRALGMGSAYVAQADEVSALYWNPAGITKIKGNEIGFTQVDWISDVKLNFLGAAVSLDKASALGVSITYLSMGEMKVTNWEHPEGTGETFESNDLAIGVTYARNLTTRFSLGLQVKYIQEKISQSTANAFAIDIGTQYDTGFHGIKIGMALTNFGSKMRMAGRDLTLRVDPYPTEGTNPDDVWANLQTASWSLPLTMRIGASVDFLDNEFMRLTGNFDFYDARDVDQMWATGGEASFMKERFFLRAGITPYYEDEIRVNFGVGFKHRFSGRYGIVIDYAYSDLGILENANRFSLGISF